MKNEKKKEREKERPNGARRNEKRNRLRGWKQWTDRPFVIRKLACSNCDRSTAVLRGREKRWKKGICREWENRRGRGY